MRATSALALLACLALARAGFAETGPFQEGERLLRYDKPAEAIPYLEKAVLEPGADERAWLYLSNCYLMLDRLDEASAALRKGLPRADKLKPLFYVCLGNVFARQGKNAFAADTYSQAISTEPSYALAYIQRANARIALKDYRGARDDYGRYLDLEPGNAQRAAIEAMIKKLDAGLATAEQAAAAAEAKKQAEEAARKELLDKMAASLKAAADETTSLSADGGDVQGYEHELKLDE